MRSSMMRVRITTCHPPRKPRRLPMIALPCSPARRLANGSRNSASGRCESSGRQGATLKAVSETPLIRDSAIVMPTSMNDVGLFGLVLGCRPVEERKHAARLRVAGIEPGGGGQLRLRCGVILHVDEQ